MFDSEFSCNVTTPPSRGALSQDSWVIAKHINKKNASKPRVLVIDALLPRLLLLLQAPVLSLSVVTFNNNAKLPPKWILREFSIANPTPARRVTPPWNVYMAKLDPGLEGYPSWQTRLPPLAGHPTYHVNVIKLKWEIIWTGGLPHLSWLPHLPGMGSPTSM